MNRIWDFCGISLTPGVLYEYLKSIGESPDRQFNDEMKGLYDAINDGDLKRLTDAYLNTEVLRYLWGYRLPLHILREALKSRGDREE
jgi:hypothetical protein